MHSQRKYAFLQAMKLWIEENPNMPMKSGYGNKKKPMDFSKKKPSKKKGKK